MHDDVKDSYFFFHAKLLVFRQTAHCVLVFLFFSPDSCCVYLLHIVVLKVLFCFVFLAPESDITVSLLLGKEGSPISRCGPQKAVKDVNGLRSGELIKL